MLFRDFIIDEECENLLTCVPRDSFWDYTAPREGFVVLDKGGKPAWGITKDGDFFTNSPPNPTNNR